MMGERQGAGVRRGVRSGEVERDGEEAWSWTAGRAGRPPGVRAGAPPPDTLTLTLAYLDVVPEHLAVALGAALAQSLASLSASRHNEVVVVVGR